MKHRDLLTIPGPSCILLARRSTVGVKDPTPIRRRSGKIGLLVPGANFRATSRSPCDRKVSGAFSRPLVDDVTIEA